MNKITFIYITYSVKLLVPIIGMFVNTKPKIIMSKYLEEIYRIRKKKIRAFMLEKGIPSINELVKGTTIGASNFSAALNKHLSEKYARAIEERYELPSLYFDIESQNNLVENKGYTLESFESGNSLFRIKNIDISNKCFYIQLIDDDIYKAGTLILFKPQIEKEVLEPNKIYLIKHNNKLLVAKSRVMYLMTNSNEKILTSEAEIIAKQLRIEF